MSALDKSDEPIRGLSKIALDYVLENSLKDTLAGCCNPYIAAFSAMDFVPEIVQLTRDHYPARQLMNHKHLKKEFTESLAAVKLAERSLRALDDSRSYDSDIMTFEALKLHQQCISFYDICCGKGILSFILTFLFPEAKINMVDNDSRMNLGHLSNPRFSNTEFMPLDLYSENAFNCLKYNISECNKVGHFSIAFGLHLCGKLSPRLVEYFNGIPGLSTLILSPCCMPTKKHGGKEINDLIRRTKWPGYDYWCLSVYTSIDERISRRDVVRDENVLSEKNIFILATKKNMPHLADELVDHPS